LPTYRPHATVPRTMRVPTSRRRGPLKVPFSTYLPIEVFKALGERAATEHVPVTELVTAALVQYLAAPPDEVVDDAPTVRPEALTEPVGEFATPKPLTAEPLAAEPLVAEPPVAEPLAAEPLTAEPAISAISSAEPEYPSLATFRSTFTERTPVPAETVYNHVVSTIVSEPRPKLSFSERFRLSNASDRK